MSERKMPYAFSAASNIREMLVAENCELKPPFIPKAPKATDSNRNPKKLQPKNDVILISTIGEVDHVAGGYNPKRGNIRETFLSEINTGIPFSQQPQKPCNPKHSREIIS